ncbi:MAG TPA: pitrilysin family protein [Vicinamibacterales bacterium]|nr:pitrilysin family protein [Vicinamibacterales bacterium]
MALAAVRRVLPNGLTVIAARNRLVPAVSVAVGVNAGAAADPAGATGTAALTARVLDKGTAAYSADAIADELDGRGASLSVGAGRQQIVVSATCLIDDLGIVLSVTCDVACRPQFPEAEVATRRAELLTAIHEATDDPGVVAVDALNAALYPGGHPLGRPVRGLAPDVAGLTRERLHAFHARAFVPAATTVVIVGDLEAEELVAAVTARMADWTGESSATVVPVAPPPESTRSLIVRPMLDKAQADVAYGFVGLARRDDDYYPALVMNNALGQYALGGRLGDSIRERQGMAYYVFSSLDAGQTAGPLMVRAGVSAENVQRTIDSIDTELGAVLTEGFTRAEVDDSKKYLIGSLPRQLETNGGIAGFLLSAEFFGFGLDHAARLPERIAAVTYDDVARVAARLLDPARAVVVVAGPWTGPAA